MFKLLKHEIKGRYKFDLVALITLIAVNASLKLGILKTFGFSPLVSSELGKFITVISCISAMALFFIRGIANLNGDLHTETGYLTFSIPLNAGKILGAKLAAALLEFLPFLLTTVYFIASMATNSFGQNGLQALFEGIRDYPVEAVLMTLYILVGYLNTMILIYLSITIAKSLLSNNKHSKLASFGIFIALNLVISYLMYGVLIGLRVDIMQANSIFGVILGFTAFSATIMYLLTQYLLERKINL